MAYLKGQELAIDQILINRAMRKLTSIQVLAFLSAFMLTLSSCEVVGGIFKAGMWVGIIVVVLVVFLVMRLLSR